MSEYVRWNPGICLGIDEIDLEHQTFVVMINQLDDHKNDPAMAPLILRALVKYAAFHFQSEENIMFEAGYPELEAHRASHLDLLDHLNIVLMELNRETHDYSKILEFFKDWYVNHTTKADMQFADFLNQQEPGKRKFLALPTLPTPSSSSGTPRVSNLSALPRSLLERLDTALRAHQDAMTSLMEDVRLADPEIAEELSQLADNQHATIASLVRATLNAQQTQASATSGYNGINPL